MIEVETQTTEVEVNNNIEVTSTGQVEVETVDLSDLDITVAKKEYVITGDDIYIPMLYDDAPQWMKDLVQVVVDVSISSGNQNLINDLSKMLQDFAVSYVPLNQYTQTILDLSDEDTRINALIETLNSNFNDGLSAANAQIISLQLTKASKDEVVAQVIQTIAAQLADGASNIGSTIGRIDQAIANETSARATSFQVLTSSLNDTNLDIAANSTALNTIRTYVGIDGYGDTTGTGLLADVEILQKQNDGIIETISGEWDVMLNTQDPEMAQLVLGAEPYASWKALDASGIDTRLAHIGDVYIKYSTTANGAKEYIASYKFIRTAVDTTSPYSTDADGFTWALIVDQAAQDAYEQALNAYELADCKSSVRYGTLVQRDATSSAWTAVEKTSNIGDIWIISDAGADQHKQFRWNGSGWIDVRDKKIIANAEAITQLGVDISNEAGLRAAGDTTVTNTVKAYADSVGAGVESKWEYNSVLGINGIYKKSGFGLTTNYTSGDGTKANPYVSEFWIDASRLKFTNSNVTGSVAPFTIDASGTTPQIKFNGVVNFSNITNVPQLGSTPQEVVTAINNAQTTTINGSKITTGTITAAQIQTNSITSKHISSYNITAANTTFGSSIIGNAQIVDASINNAKIADLSVDTLKIANNAVTVPTVATNPNIIEIPPNSVWITLVSAAMYVSGGSVIIIPHCLGNRIGSTTAKIHFRVLRNGTEIYTTTGDNGFSLTDTESDTFTFSIIDIPGVGIFNYEFQAYCYRAEGTVRNISLSLLGAKK